MQETDKTDFESQALAQFEKLGLIDWKKNADDYLSRTKRQLEQKKKLDKHVQIPFLSAGCTNRQVYLNPALPVTAVNPLDATARDYETYPLMRTDAVITADGVKTEMIRRPVDGEVCVIDWISLTMKATTFENHKSQSEILEEFRLNVLVDNVSDVLKDLIGFGVDYRNKSGRNFYERSYTLEHDAGYICIGGQNDTVMICINGTGCTYGKKDWEENLNIWLLMFADEPKITRIDLAHDDLYGAYTTVDWFNEQHSIGGFTRGGPIPKCEYRGDWKFPKGKGRTLYIGSRQSSKFVRIYEKGKQLGDPDSMWLRIEVEFKSKDIFIPLDVLLKPSEFFTCAYPCFDVFEFQGSVSKVETKDKQDLMTWQQAIELVKHQYGRYLHFFRAVIDDDTQLLDVLTDISNTKPPERIDPLTIPNHG